jgi:hypothetical protein
VDRRDADPFRGLYLSDDDVDRLLTLPEPAPRDDVVAALLARVEAGADRAEAAGAVLRLRLLVNRFGLQPFDLELLLVALAPDLDQRFEWLFGYLHDDVSRRRASIGLGLELAGSLPLAAVARSRLRPGAPLIDGGLITIGDLERPFLTRTLSVPDRVVMYLLGDDTPDALIARLIEVPPPCPAGEPGRLADTLAHGALLSYLRERRGTGAAAFAAAAFAELGMPSLVLQLERLDGRDAAAAAAAARCEARLLGAGLVAGPVEPLGDAVAAWCDPAWPVVLFGQRSWDPDWSAQVPLVIEAPAAGASEILHLWEAVLDDDTVSGLDLRAAVATANLAPAQVQRAATAAWWQARHAGRPVGGPELRQGIQLQNAAGLERLAHRVEPAVGWPDIVLPPRPRQLLHELTLRVRHHARVLDEWGMRRTAGSNAGVSALFAGPSGTGKTMAAEVIAYELGFDLYTVDLATVVDKYIGETEKNLERIFVEAERVNGVLFFDEADALFGKRSDVKDAHDRYANVETAFLLQRMENFDGVAILATNLRANVDDAFTRRLDAIVDFPAPDAEHRRLIWERALRPTVPRAGDVDLDLLAERFSFTGGNIRNIALAAAYFAAHDDRPVGMADLIRATQREFLKLGRLGHPSDFAPYEDLLA